MWKYTKQVTLASKKWGNVEIFFFSPFFYLRMLQKYGLVKAGDPRSVSFSAGGSPESYTLFFLRPAACVLYPA
jgi:hypothetical protein